MKKKWEKLSELADKEFLRTYKNQLLIELYVAYLEARANGKRKTIDEQKFETNEMENLKILCDVLYNKQYKPARGVAHIIHNPVIREIFAAPFVDRVIHHWIYDKIYEWWDRHFIYDAYSCRVGKGTLKGIQRLDKMIRRASKNYTQTVWVVKMDISGYFMSIDRKLLYERVMWGLNRQYEGKTDTKEYELLKYAIKEVIFDDPVDGVKLRGYPKHWRRLPRNKSLLNQPPGKGIVIGNLTSQLFSNILLDMLDRYIKFDLGYKYYGRYVDDFFMVLNETEMKNLQRDIKAIRQFLRGLGLKLHPNKIYIQKMERGTQFLGGVVYPGHVQPSERIKRNYQKALRQFMKGTGTVESMRSYMGHVEHLAHYKFEQNIYKEVGWNKVDMLTIRSGERGDPKQPN